MKKPINLKRLRTLPDSFIYEKKQQKLIHRIYDRFSIRNIFLVWVFTLIGFGLVYFFLQSDTAYLKMTQVNTTPTFMDHIYFSFITATSTGFGDVIPKGFFKTIAIFEVIIGLSLFAMVTSKLVSIKQDAILGEIYEIAYYEKISRLRNALYLSRVDIQKIRKQIKDEEITEKDLTEIWMPLSQLRNTIEEVKTTVAADKSSDILKKVDELDIELILYSVSLSLKRVLGLLNTMGNRGIDWKSDYIVRILQNMLSESREICQYYKKVGSTEKILNNVKDIEIMVNDITTKFFYEILK